MPRGTRRHVFFHAEFQRCVGEWRAVSWSRRYRMRAITHSYGNVTAPLGDLNVRVIDGTLKPDPYPTPFNSKGFGKSGASKNHVVRTLFKIA